MAATELTVNELTRVGLSDTSFLINANADGHFFKNDGKTILVVKNAGASPINVTIATVVTADGIIKPGYGKFTDSNVIQAVANGVTKLGGIFPKQRFNDANGYVNITLSAVTSVQIGVVKIDLNK